MSRRHREFNLNEEEIIEYLFADNSDDETDLQLDEEDRRFLTQDLASNTSYCIIDPPSPTELTSPTLPTEPSSDPTPTNTSWKWKKNSYSPNKFTNPDFEYGKPSFDNVNNNSPPRPIDVFLQTVNFDTMVEEIIIPESMRYAQQNGHPFTIDKEEIYAFLGMNYVMGYHILPSFRSYWSTEPDMGVPYISQVMPLHRFEEIRRNLHFNDNQSGPKDDRAYKIRRIMDHLNKAFEQALTATKYQAIDEHMVKFKGHNIMKQFIKNKPVKWGFKVWCRCDSETGYLFEFDLYTGRKNHGSELGLGESVVLQLTDKIKGLGCEVFFDNFFNSPSLQMTLRDSDIKSCGTVRTNRKNLPKIVPHDKDMKRGEIFFLSYQGISYIKWKDNKGVNFLTNYISPLLTSTVKRRDGSEKINIVCPQVVSLYNQYMGGVDLMDQKKVCYELDRKSTIKYYLRLFFDLMDIAMNNAFITYSKIQEKYGLESPKLTNLSFRQSVARGLIGGFTSRKRNATSYIQTQKRLRCVAKPTNNTHIIEKSNTRKRCCICWKNKTENKTFNKCKSCDIYLCFTSTRNCFEIYHSS